MEVSLLELSAYIIAAWVFGFIMGKRDAPSEKDGGEK